MVIARLVGLMDRAVCDPMLLTSPILDRPGPQILHTNKAFEHMTGYVAEDIRGDTPRLFQGPKTDKQILCDLKDSCRVGREFAAVATNYDRTGEEYVVQWVIRPVRYSGSIIAFLSVQRNLDEVPVMSRVFSVGQVFDIVEKELGAGLG